MKKKIYCALLSVCMLLLSVVPAHATELTTKFVLTDELNIEDGRLTAMSMAI